MLPLNTNLFTSKKRIINDSQSTLKNLLKTVDYQKKTRINLFVAEWKEALNRRGFIQKARCEYLTCVILPYHP